MHAVEVWAKVKKSNGQNEERKFEYMAKCLPSEKAKADWLRDVSWMSV